MSQLSGVKASLGVLFLGGLGATACADLEIDRFGIFADYINPVFQE